MEVDWLKSEIMNGSIILVNAQIAVKNLNLENAKENFK